MPSYGLLLHLFSKSNIYTIAMRWCFVSKTNVFPTNFGLIVLLVSALTRILKGVC